jgi:hypothetical protein
VIHGPGPAQLPGSNSTSIAARACGIRYAYGYGARAYLPRGPERVVPQVPADLTDE